MGLDQAILIGPKGERPEGALMVFRKHDRLHGFMERLSYQKNIVDPFDQVEVDWDEVERRVFDEVQAQFGGEGVLKPGEAEMKELETSEKPAEHIVYNPTFDMSEYAKGRLTAEHLVPLEEEDFICLIETLDAFMSATSDQERDAVLPPCRGLFFGESTEEEWAKTALMFHLVFNQFGFEDYDFYYHSEW